VRPVSVLRIIIAPLLAAALALPGTAAASASLTPVGEAGGRATDNAGDRPDELGRNSAVTATAAAGARLVISQPLWSLRMEGLGEYERYLSAPVKNTGASGGLDGKWRPDERTFVRSLSRVSYAPDRFDPRVPYRLALTVPAGQELPPFVRVTTTRISEGLTLEHRLTEAQRFRVFGQWTDTRYSDRRVGDEAFEPVLMQGRSVLELGGESLWETRENVETGFYAEGSRADYEVTNDAYTASTGAVVEWNIVERLQFRARTGPDFTTFAGTDLPDRWGIGANGSFLYRWTLAEIELAGREGMFLADATIPAARRREGRLTFRATPFERLSMELFAGAGAEKSQYAAYHATGSARLLTAGGSLGWRLTERFTARAGYQHTDVATSGRSDLPYESSMVFAGISFTGWSLGSPAPEASRP
jgi:hypothetical protein